MDFNKFYQLRFLFLFLIISCKSFHYNKSYYYSKNDYSVEMKILNKKDATLIIKNKDNSNSRFWALKYRTKIEYIISYENKSFKQKNNKVIKYFFEGTNINCILIDNECANFSEGMITSFSKDLLFKDFSMKRN